MGSLLAELARWVMDVVHSFGYVGVFVLVLSGSLYLPIPTELTLPLFGFLVGQGRLSFVPVVLTATAARVVAALISVPAGLKRMPILGRFLGYTVLGATSWTGSLVVLGWVLGRRWRLVELYASFIAFGVLVVLVLGSLWFLWRPGGTPPWGGAARRGPPGDRRGI